MKFCLKFVLGKRAPLKGLPTLMAITLTGVGGCLSPPSPPPPLHLQGTTMGTEWHMVVVPASDSVSPAHLSRLTQAELDHLDSLFTLYDSSSLLMSFNLSDSLFCTGDTDFWELFEVAEIVYRLSGGAYDPTVGVLVRWWGFGSEDTVVFSEPFDTLRMLVGLDSVVGRVSDTCLWKRKRGVELDFNSIVKGFAAEKVAVALLRNPAIRGVLVEVGGEVYMSGEPPAYDREEALWRVGIEDPFEPFPFAFRRNVFAIVGLPGGWAVATSGNYRQWKLKGQDTATHIIDPRTGKPALTGVASATIIHTSGAKADAWATAAVVLGCQRAHHLLDSLNIYYVLICGTSRENYTIHKRLPPQATFQLVGRGARI